MSLSDVRRLHLSTVLAPWTSSFRRDDGHKTGLHPVSHASCTTLTYLFVISNHSHLRFGQEICCLDST